MGQRGRLALDRGQRACLPAALGAGCAIGLAKRPNSGHVIGGGGIPIAVSATLILVWRKLISSRRKHVEGSPTPGKFAIYVAELESDGRRGHIERTSFAH